MGFLNGKKIGNLKIFGQDASIVGNIWKILLSVCKDQVASYQLNMFGVAVFGSIPRWTSLYRTESKYPANPAKIMGITTVTKGTINVWVVWIAKFKHEYSCIPCTRHDPVSGSISNCSLVYLRLLASGEKFGWVKVKTYRCKGDQQISWHK